MKKIIYLSIIFLAVFSACRKEITDEKSSVSAIHIYGGSDMDIVRKLLKTKDGDYIICGYTKSFNGGVLDGYLIKVDKDLKMLWQHNYGGPGEDRFDEIIETRDGGFLICGASLNGGIDPSTGKTYVDLHPYIVKTDALGNVAWEKHLRFSKLTWDYVLQNFEESDDHFTFLGRALNKFGYTEPVTVKTDKNGNVLKIIWNKVVNYPSACTGVVKTADNTYAGIGYTSTSVTNNYACYFKFNENDSIVDKKAYEKIPTEKYLFYWNINNLPGNNLLLTTATTDNLILVKADATGNQIWKKYIVPDTKGTNSFRVKVNEAGEIFLLKSFTTPLFLIKLDAEGNKIFEKQILEYAGGADLIFEDNGIMTVLAYKQKDVKSENIDIMIFRINSEGEIIYE